MALKDKYSKDKVFYSQNKEDLLLEAFFPDLKNGFYVDLGAYDPEYDSVTKLFYDMGWSGINVEPQPERYKKFVKDRPRDININCGVSSESGEFTLRAYENGGLSTFSTELQKSYSKVKDKQFESYKDIKVPVMTLKEILQKHKIKKINFLKIDVEGLEYEVIKGNDWESYRPEVICIESNNILKDWKSFLFKKDYRLIFFDGLNDYYIDNRSNKIAVFDYVKHIIEDRGEYLKYSDYCAFEAIIKESDRMQNNIDRLELSEKNKDDLINHLNQMLKSPRVLFSLFIKQAIKKLLGKNKQ